MTHAMELLAPAGGEEQLDYAILFGADAVYLACQQFGMRARAANFDLEDLPRIIAKAHAKNVKVHLTCNVMMTQDDIQQLPPFLEQAAQAGVDALIVGDMGAAVLARRHAPGVGLHVSTQASVCNAEAAKAWYQLGATRIVAARELSLSSLAALKAGMPQGMELEAFAHGAMCMGYSGRCLVSDHLNGRSGVHGNCAQSCRWQYALNEYEHLGDYRPLDIPGKGRYILNADDICMLEHLDDLADAGVDSIKIEGRNKKAYYVACVVNAYRQVLDGAEPALLLPELENVSHRPYSTGFYYGSAHQTDQDLIYLRGTSWAAQVLESAKAEDGRWQIKFKCRTRFSPADSLELVSPRKLVRSVTLNDLRYDPTSRTAVLSDKASPDWHPVSEEPLPVSVADHPAEHYFAVVDAEAHPGDIIRAVR